MGKALIVDDRINIKSALALENMGYSLIRIKENPTFPRPVCAHPDMFAVKIKDMWFVDSYTKHLFVFSESITEISREVTDGKTIRYPDDVGLNCAFFGNRIICNKKYTHSLILEYAKCNGIEIIDVNQGYAKCSTCIVDGNSIITEDESIEKAAKEHGVEVLKIQKGYVRLDGYDYGFIGGCCGLIENNVLAFNGRIENHPDYDKICDFCNKRNVGILSLCDEILYDIGSIIAV